jgi:hypothetical protein
MTTNTNKTTVLEERYEIEFIEDSGDVYESGDSMDAKDFVNEYIECQSEYLADVCEWLRSIPVPQAVAFVTENWGIKYKLHLITTTDTIIN